MKKEICILMAIMLLAGTAGGIFANENKEIDYTTGTPWLCIDLEGVVTKDTPAERKDNYALYVNKEAILALEIPEGYSYAGTFADLVRQNKEDIKNMFLGEAPQGHDALLAYNLFKLMMDWDSRNALGVAPLKEEIDQVEAIDTIDALSEYYIKTPKEKWASSLYGSGITPDLADTSRNILVVTMCPLLLDDSAEYGALTAFGEIKKSAVTKLAEKMLVKLGYSEEESAKKIENCFAFETMVAPSIYTKEERGRPDYIERVNNVYTRDELAAAQGNLPILKVLEQAGYPDADRYMVFSPAYLECLNKLYTEENLPVIRDFMIVHDVVNSAELLDRECYEWYNDYENEVSGSSGILDDATAFSSEVSGELEWPVAQLYTETYLRAEDKERITGMVNEILEAYHGILEEADFLSDETREKALEKLDAITVNVLYPDDWEKYSCEGLEILSPEEGGTFYQANQAVEAYKNSKQVKEYSEPIDKEKWKKTPQTVNCAYGLINNSINILGAFAQGKMYNSTMSDEELYATLGTVIGHEISHAFDSSGAQFDKEGNLANWWTEEDLKTFTERNEKLAAYFNAMHPWEGQNFYGSIMTGEACADMAGMRVILRLAAGMENFDYDTFFRTFAVSYLIKETLQETYSCIRNNHPLDYLRVNTTLQQFDEFLDFYGITEGDGMYLAEEERVCIW